MFSWARTCRKNCSTASRPRGEGCSVLAAGLGSWVVTARRCVARRGGLKHSKWAR
uniref:Uncharacterized protein n=1 Tax=Human herpesvirus 2 TaxID=10310 RepID=A0A481TN08_HHV2|nr:hypothetical protein [Human alphaherpesvirus 2]QBH78437.1 hypothetical protein [Human alphaherpesvirus 2]QBH78552.1 hypothetical protein [Human alphaherpesvirus 2]QBH79336.1 hypothetical protein [Human alphaherpesvirus 2]QBH79679.1 hypothetical protein [Human alphaherpesvirus 2]